VSGALLTSGVFNPINQARNSDPARGTTPQMVPNASALPDVLQSGLGTPGSSARSAGLDWSHLSIPTLISHAIAREVALEAFSRIRPH